MRLWRFAGTGSDVLSDDDTLILKAADAGEVDRHEYLGGTEADKVIIRTLPSNGLKLD